MPSEVTALLARIDAEYSAARIALHGLASGTARHEVINASMGRAQVASERLIEVIGTERALPLIVKAMDKGAS